MKIPYNTKLLLAICVGMIVFIAGCVDLSVQPIPGSIDFSSQIKVVNLVSGAGTATLTLNGQSLGSAEFGSEVPGSQSNFLTIPAGSKTLSVSFASAENKDFKFAATTDYKMRAFLWGDSSSNELAVNLQRYIFQTPGSDNGKALFPADTGQVAFFDGSIDAVILSVDFMGADTTTVDFEATSGALESGDGSVYIKLKAGSYTFNIGYSTLAGEKKNITIVDYTVGALGRYTAVIYDVEANLKTAVFVDD